MLTIQESTNSRILTCKPTIKRLRALLLLVNIVKKIAQEREREREEFKVANTYLQTDSTEQILFPQNPYERGRVRSRKQQDSQSKRRNATSCIPGNLEHLGSSRRSVTKQFFITERHVDSPIIITRSDRRQVASRFNNLERV